MNKAAIMLVGSVVCGAVLTLLMMVFLYKYLVGVERTDFAHDMQIMDHHVAASIEDVRDELRGLAVVLYAANEVTSDTLRFNAEHAFVTDNAIVSVLFALKVKEEERVAFESMQQDAGFMDYRVHDVRNTQHVPATQRATYFPVHLIEPFDVDHVPLLGLDIMHVASLQVTLIDAIDNARDVSVVVRLTGDQSSLWIFKAIYTGFSGVSDPYFIENRHDMVNGFVGIEVDLQKLLVPSALPKDMSVSFSVEGDMDEKSQRLVPLLSFGQQQGVAWWTGFSLEKSYIYPLNTQKIHLQGRKVIGWFDGDFLLFFLSGFVGLGFTLMLFLSLRTLMKSETKNRNILDSAFEGVISVDSWGKVMEVNPAAKQIFGCAGGACACEVLDDMIAVPMWDKAKFPKLEDLVQAHPEVLSELHELHGGSVFSKKLDNDQLVLEVSISQVGFAASPLFTLFVRDVTEKKSREQKLARLAMVVEQSFNLILITNKQGVIEYVNPAFERVSGYSAAEALGQKPSIVKSGVHPEQYYAKMWKTIQSGERWVGEFTNKRKTGELYEVEQTILPIYEQDAFVGFVSVQQDVTDKKRLQTQSEHTQRLESLGVLAGGIAHDFNNLLTAIMGHARLAQRQAEEGSSQSQHLDHIVDASESAASLCRQMLAYSGQGSFVIKALDLSEVVNGISQLLVTSVGKRVVMRMQLEKALPLIEGDEGQLQQIIMNLIINASEAIAEAQGVIDVQTCVTTLDEEAIETLLNHEQLTAGDYITLKVSDSGCGMSTEVISKMFDPFFTTKFTGRGLGMSAILGIVRGHHAGLRVTSYEGEGTMFEVFFPVSAEQNKRPQEEKVKRVTQSITGTVLVVDDEAMVREFTVMLLQDEGLEVLTAEDGVEGLSMLKEHQSVIDVVLLDMTMPRMSGDEFYKQMRVFEKDMPVIVTSGYAEQEIKARFDDDGSLLFIHKPYDPDLLLHKIRGLL